MKVNGVKVLITNFLSLKYIFIFMKIIKIKSVKPPPEYLFSEMQKCLTMTSSSRQPKETPPKAELPPFRGRAEMEAWA